MEIKANILLTFILQYFVQSVLTEKFRRFSVGKNFEFEHYDKYYKSFWILDGGWTNINNNWYLLEGALSQRRSFSDAMNYCQERGGYVFEPKDAGLVTEIQRLLGIQSDGTVNYQIWVNVERRLSDNK